MGCSLDHMTYLPDARPDDIRCFSSQPLPRRLSIGLGCATTLVIVAATAWILRHLATGCDRNNPQRNSKEALHFSIRGWRFYIFYIVAQIAAQVTKGWTLLQHYRLMRIKICVFYSYSFPSFCLTIGGRQETRDPCPCYFVGIVPHLPGEGC